MSALLKPSNDRNFNLWRNQFPIFTQKMNGKPLVYLDSASSAQKPQTVMDAMNDVMRTEYANIHRGLYGFSQNLTAKTEDVRAKVAHFIKADSAADIIFTRNTTEAINLVAHSWVRKNLKAGDEILITEMEHHANIVPWQMLRDEKGIVLKVLPITDDGALDATKLPQFINIKTKLFTFTHVSNMLGTINDAAGLTKTAKSLNPEIKVLVDGSQSVVHETVNVQAIGCDFFAFTGHKIYGPTGIGVLYARSEILAHMPPFMGGGDMIEKVTFKKTTYKSGAARFEAGTPAIVEIIGLGAAIDFVSAIPVGEINVHEKTLLNEATQKLQNIKGLKIYGTAPHKAAIIAFTLEGCHTSDIAMILDQQGIAVRTGHHCCMPLMQRLSVEGTVRASFGLYNTLADVDSLVAGVEKAREMLAP